ncbi:MAG TPA: PKD domain-containing protein [Xanthomonadaceae bacterium]|nr:PKD domain-containing protein [Xanthomonadaceae bacterium]
MFRSRWLLLFLLCLAAAAPALAQVQVHGVESVPATPLTLGLPVQFQAQASAAGGGALEYRWDFGDGTPRTDWLPDDNVNHLYQGAGAFTVLVQVRHATQGLASATKPVVVRLPAGPAAAASSPILMHVARREVWVAHPDHGSIGVMDADLFDLLAEIDSGGHASSLALDPFGQVWVNSQDEDVIRRIDPVSRSVTAQIDLGYGARPVALVFDALGTGYVALAGPGRVQRFDPGTAEPGPALDVAPAIEALAVRADAGALYVSSLVSRGESGTVWRIDLPAFDQADPIALPLDTTSPDSGTAARGLPNYVAALALTEDGGNLWYGAKKDNLLRGLFREGQALTFETTMRSLVGRIDAGTSMELVPRRMDLDDAGRVSALLLAPGSSHLFAAQETNNRVLVLDPWNRRELTQLPVGRAPRGLAFDPVERRLFVQNFLSRTVSVFAVGDQLDDGASPVEALGSFASASWEPLDADVLLGKRVFYNAADTRMAQDGYFSCAACHLDGRNDGQVWDFTQLGEGLRNTTSLIGNAGMGRGLLHWTGNFDEVQDFETPIRNLFGGLGFMDDGDYFADGRDHPLGPTKAGFSQDLDALAAFLASLDRDDRSPFRQPDGSLSPEGIAGRQLFAQLSCHRCHAGEAFTDSPQGYRHDVGTLTAASGGRLGEEALALDTPSLRGLFGSAPYLHDGSAESLEAVLLERNPGGAHGDTATLDAEELAELVSFLLQIDANEPGMGPAAQLDIVAPGAGQSVVVGDQVALAITSDLPQIVRVDYRVDLEIVASALAPPWSTAWTASDPGLRSVHADVLHDDGRFQTLSAPRSLQVMGLPIFADGFEAGTD